MEFKDRLTRFFWIFFSLTVLLQLSTSKELPFGTALLYTMCVLLTLRLYLHYIAHPAVQRYLARLNSGLLPFLMIISAFALALLLAAQGYAIVLLTMSEAAASIIINDSTAVFFGLFLTSGFIIGFNYFFEKYKESLAQEKELETLKRKSLEMEISLLRNQLSPHFTFNILNNLQFLIRKDKNAALNLLSAYSKILRYYVYESQKKRIAFEQEVAFLKEYFDLEVNRHVANLQISSEWVVPDKNFQIMPFILSTFVENAFKHVLPNRDNKYYISQACVLSEQGRLSFEIVNTFDEDVIAKKPKGVGLKHVRDRLNLAYPMRHHLRLKNSQGLFRVTLELHLEK